jgi:hypothetical protein
MMTKRKFYDEPEWIKKSIVYFCENYTIDKAPLDKHEALKAYQYPTDQGWRSLDKDAIAYRFDWEASVQGYSFWDCLWFLQDGSLPAYQEVKCLPWTDADKRMIDKLPAVKV